MNGENINWKLVATRLWGILDDIDTGFDHYKPNMNEKFVKYVSAKVLERQKYMQSKDGQTLEFVGIPIIEDLDPMCKWFKDAWQIEKDK